jgi:hypothetical protein
MDSNVDLWVNIDFWLSLLREADDICEYESILSLRSPVIPPDLNGKLSTEKIPYEYSIRVRIPENLQNPGSYSKEIIIRPTRNGIYYLSDKTLKATMIPVKEVTKETIDNLVKRIHKTFDMEIF